MSSSRDALATPGDDSPPAPGNDAQVTPIDDAPAAPDDDALAFLGDDAPAVPGDTASATVGDAFCHTSFRREHTHPPPVAAVEPRDRF